jgi:hypothetical protein
LRDLFGLIVCLVCWQLNFWQLKFWRLNYRRLNYRRLNYWRLGNRRLGFLFSFSDSFALSFRGLFCFSQWC